MSARFAICAVLVVGAGACGEREQPPSRPRGLTPSEAPSAPAAPLAPSAPVAPPPPPSSLPSPFATGKPDPGALANPNAASAKLEEEAGAALAQEPKRDLGVELAQLVGQPLSCVDFAAIVAGGGKLTITISAQVVPSGRITRAEVSAPGQPKKAQQCIEQLVTAGSFQGPVPGAPRNVTTNVTLQVVANAR